MIVPDLNLLVYTFNASAKAHMKAARWWEDLLTSHRFVGIPWVVYVGFLRLMTGRHVLQDPYEPKAICDMTAAWFEFDHVQVLPTTNQTREILDTLVAKYNLSGGMITDAAIAAAAMEHGAVIHSNDSDFALFSEVQVINPLA